MSADLETLARRAVACPRWRWMAGMAAVREDAHTLTDHPTGFSFQASEIRATTATFEVCEPEHRFVEVSLLLNGKTRSYGSMFTMHLLPDLSDPATVGCLAALVRTATGKPHLFAQFTLQESWSICDLHDHRSHFVGSEAEAWIEVLEEVP